MSWTVDYYENHDGDCPIEAFLNKLSVKARAKCLAYIGLLEKKGYELPSSFIKQVRGKVWELRPEWAGNEYRFFYVGLVGKRFVVLNAIQKKSQKLKDRDIKIAEDRYAEILRRETDEEAPAIRQRAH